jgi:predicted hydrocarbon binding protein
MKNIFTIVPEEVRSEFENAQSYVESYFEKLNMNAQEGFIEIGGERYILIRTDLLSVDFHDLTKQNFPSVNPDQMFRATSKVRYDLGKVFGAADARSFHEKMNVNDPIAKLSSGPIHFAFSGWGFVKIHDESKPTPNEDFYLLYDHPNSFESYSWLKRGKSKFCTCFISAGYSAGWCAESFKIELEAREISCRATGDSECRFIMSQPHRLEEFIYDYKKQKNLI